MLKGLSFISVKRNVSNEYSDYQFHFYLEDLSDQILGYRWKCYFLYTQERFTTFPIQHPKKWKFEAAHFQSYSQKSPRVLDVANK